MKHQIPVIEDSYFEQFATKKYTDASPIMRNALRNFMGEIYQMFCACDSPESVMEIGCGQGFVSGFLSEHFPSPSYSGLDLREKNISKMQELFPHIKGETKDFYEFNTSEVNTDVILCCEVLEHLPDPAGALQKFKEMNPKDLIISVPHEPWFRIGAMLRGKNLSRWGNPKDHLNHWNKSSFSNLISEYFEVQSVKTPFPWLIVHAKASS